MKGAALAVPGVISGRRANPSYSNACKPPPARLSFGIFRFKPQFFGGPFQATVLRTHFKRQKEAACYGVRFSRGSRLPRLRQACRVSSPTRLMLNHQRSSPLARYMWLGRQRTALAIPIPWVSARFSSRWAAAKPAVRSSSWNTSIWCRAGLTCTCTSTRRNGSMWWRGKWPSRWANKGCTCTRENPSWVRAAFRTPFRRLAPLPAACSLPSAPAGKMEQYFHDMEDPNHPKREAGYYEIESIGPSPFWKT